MKLLDEKGQGLSEYLILTLLIAVASIAMVKGLGQAVRERIEDAKVKINQLRVDREG